MADKKKTASKSNSRKKGVALAKWMKIDKAQRNMLVAVCCASIVLGVTIVGVVYFIKVIGFNATLLDEKGKIAKDYKTIQGNLRTLSSSVDELTTNENLEVVARTRSSSCPNEDDEVVAEDSEENAEDTEKEETKADTQSVEVRRTCTSLRVIPDALPSKSNQEATLASMNQLLIWSDPSLQIETIGSGSSSSSYYEGENDGSLKSLDASIMLSDSSGKIYRALDVVERSIRNFDITSATISFSDDDRNSGSIDLNATYKAYYADARKINTSSKKICADKNSKKCSGKSKK